MGRAIGLGTGVTQLLDALGRLCDAEGLAASDLHSINFLDDEIEVVIARADGSRRHDIYPMAALRDQPTRSGVPLVAPQIREPPAQSEEGLF